MAETPIEGTPAATPPAAEPATAATRGAHGPVLLVDRYQINADRPLPELSTPSASAFAVDDRRDIGRRLFALVCTPGLPLRHHAATALRGSQVLNLLPLVEWGAVDWPPLGQRCMVVVYERPMGGRLIDVITTEGGQIPDHDLQRRVIEPLAAGLQEMVDRGIAHRAIRPGNLFFMDAERQSLVLGDCVTTPPAFDQPVAFETVTRGMATRSGRGEGSVADDLYALGVTLAFLHLGENPVADISEDALLYAKIEHGSYATLCGGGRIPLFLLELLRGLLSDDPEERWGLRELTLWIDGRRMTPIQKRPLPKPETRFTFAGHNHVTPRTLAHAFSRNVGDAARALKDGQVDPWVRRSLLSVGMADEIARVVEMARTHAGEPRASDDMTVAKVCMILDPEGPLRYKGYAFLIDAFGTALAVELLRQGNAKVGAEILDQNLPGIWLERAGPGSWVAAQTRQFEKLRGFLHINSPGNGIERCLYELNSSLPCQSSLIIQDYVVDMENLLPALDGAAGRVDTKIPPVDRHIAAFIATHFDEDIERHLRAMADSTEARKTAGMLSLLALVQWRLGPEALYGLSSWIGGLLGPVIASYHSRTVRRDIEREVPRLVRQGSLPALFELIDNAEQRLQDEKGYRAAVEEFLLAESEVQEIESSDSARAESAERLGQQTAAMTSVVVTLIFVTIIFLNEIW